MSDKITVKRVRFDDRQWDYLMVGSIVLNRHNMVNIHYKVGKENLTYVHIW